MSGKIKSKDKTRQNAEPGGKKRSFNPAEYEPKWAKKWVDGGIYKADDFKGKKSYLLIEFPYTSGERLHVGHGRSYACLDAVARKRRMQGENVLYPIGWDAFGLPAENYAIKTGINPAITTKKIIDDVTKQVVSWGLSFDWSREVDTTDPKYYKWTQWIFLQLFKRGLAYKANIPVNWCPSCKINLANEEVVDGKCERCGTQTERRMQSQWLIEITKYADRLLSDLSTVNFRDDIASQQVGWIGRKEGINITYRIANCKQKITVFTTRPDTNFGATFIVVAPEYYLVDEVISGRVKVDPKLIGPIKEYVRQAKNKSELDRIAEGRKKTGVSLGLAAINGLNGRELPIYVSDFVLATVGTGAVVGVPGHDVRDFEFAREKRLPIIRVVVGKDEDTSEIDDLSKVQEEEGTMVNSDFLNGMDIHKATSEIMDYLEKRGWGKRTVSYHLRDWVFSRQHYWGEPIPMVYCEKCAKNGKNYFNSRLYKGSANLGKEVAKAEVDQWVAGVMPRMAGWYPVSENELPVELPRVEKYQPSGTGESPLANVGSWLKVTCPGCGGVARRETDTMPNWAGSNWYFVRYCDPNNLKSIGDPKILKYWLPVDWYNGGMEHTTLHLLYSRFVYKFLYDIGAVPTPEPYAKRTSHGVVLGSDGQKMSKSKGNVINPDRVIAKYGADAFRMYEMFIGPFEQMVVWNDRALAGVYRFLARVWDLSVEVVGGDSSKEAKRQAARLVIKVGNDLENLKFNTAVSACMEFVNWWTDHKGEVGKDVLADFLKTLAPMAPFMAEELWQRLKPNSKFSSVHLQPWPEVDNRLIKEAKQQIVVQVNGKTRGVVEIEAEKVTQEMAEAAARSNSRINQHLEGRTASKIIWVEGKLINFVVK